MWSIVEIYIYTHTLLNQRIEVGTYARTYAREVENLER